MSSRLLSNVASVASAAGGNAALAYFLASAKSAGGSRQHYASYALKARGG